MDEIISCKECPFKSVTKRGVVNHKNVVHRNSEQYNIPCQICSKKFSSEKYLKQHQTQVHGLLEHKCELCHFATTTKGQLHDHIKTHEQHKVKEPYNVESANFSCPKCEYKTYSNSGLKQHIANSHRENHPFKCGQCNYSCKLERELRYHVKTKHTDKLLYSCDICGKHFKYKENIKHHLKQQHSGIEFKCDLCDHKSKSKSQLQSHVNSIHTKEIKYTCSLCSYVSYSKGPLKNHVVNMHNDSEDQRKFQCDQCLFKAKTKEKLQDHKDRVHVDIKAFKCELCDYSAKVPKDIKSHKKIHHSENVKTHQCTVCEYTSAWHANVRRHFKTTHEKLKEHKCDICGQTFTVKNALQKHQFTLHGIDDVPKYHCSEKDCNYETIHANVLKNHVIAKHETITQTCKICSAVLKNSITLKLHMTKMHSKIKKVYKCPQCPVQYFRLGTYKEHILVEHSEGELEKHKCSYCNWTSVKKSAWYVHERNHRRKLYP